MYYLTFDNHSLSIIKSNNQHQSLAITYQTYQLHLQHHPILASSFLQFESLLGLKVIKSYAFLLIVSQVEQKGTIGMSRVNQIKKVQWVAVAPQSQQIQILNLFQSQLTEISNIFKDGLHYYSDLYDLTFPYNYNKIKPITPNIETHYAQFNWNHNLARMDGLALPNSQLFYNFCHKVIQGYLVEFNVIKPNGDRLKYVVISRRSTKKAGTRFYARGIDDDGNVANFVQTEQIIFEEELIFTHIQIRGSVPAFFCQVGVNGLADDLIIQRNEILTKNPFLKHFKQLQEIYNRVLCVNLLSEKKEQQNNLSMFFESLVDKNSKETPYLRYQFYDFHEWCKGNKFQNSQNLIQKLSGVAQNFGFSCYNRSKGIFQAQQTGVFRTNCLDCLDRTNYVQSRLALKSLELFFLKFGDQKTKQIMTEKGWLHTPSKFQFLGSFNNAWADNGDSVSILYTGIQSTHTDITRTGERTFGGSIHHKYKSLMRFFVQFSDHKKQNGINELTNPSKVASKKNLLNEFHTTLFFSMELGEVQSQMSWMRKRIQSRRSQILILFVWVGGQVSVNLFSKIKNLFQKSQSVLQPIQEKWSKLAQQNNYTLLTSLDSSNSSISAFCRNDCLENVGDIKSQKLSCEGGGEALLIKIKIVSSYFIFSGVNCQSLAQFMSVFDQIHDKGFQQSRLGVFKSKSLLDVEYRVIFGNTGTNLMINQEEMRSLTAAYKSLSRKTDQRESSRLSKRILDSDQLSQDEIKYKNRYFRLYNQGPLQFIPHGNRLFFWNEEGVILRLREYQAIPDKGLTAILDYEVGRGLQNKV